jgi:hypothetical protein
MASSLLFALCATLPWLTPEPLETIQVLARYRTNIDRGLQWLSRQQHRDGHWEGPNGTHRVSMTALAGLAMLSEGSVPERGTYAKSIDDAIEFLLGHAQAGGLIADRLDASESRRYLFGHGYAMLFLSQAYPKDPAVKRRAEILKVLTKAAEFTAAAQTSRGGWGYVPAWEGSDFDEGATTLTQIQALCAARAVGVPVAQEVLARGLDYVRKSTLATTKDPDAMKVEAGVVYSQQAGGTTVRPALTAAAGACWFTAGELSSELLCQWLNYCQKHLPPGKNNAAGLREYTDFYHAQLAYYLGENLHARLRPDLAELEATTPATRTLLTWSRYRTATFDQIAQRQTPEGNWSDTSSIGPVYATSVYVLILQLDKAALPLFRR